jgi:nitric oxide reductase NorQ protein
VDAAKLIRSGLPKRLAVKVAIIEPLTDDEEIITALTDMANLMI